MAKWQVLAYSAHTRIKSCSDASQRGRGVHVCPCVCMVSAVLSKFPNDAAAAIEPSLPTPSGGFDGGGGGGATEA